MISSHSQIAPSAFDAYAGRCTRLLRPLPPAPIGPDVPISKLPNALTDFFQRRLRSALLAVRCVHSDGAGVRAKRSRMTP